MRAFILFIVAVLILTLLSVTQAKASPDHSHCIVVGIMAEEVMLGRQTGRSISSFMEFADTIENQGMADIFRNMVFRAYEEQAYISPGSQQFTIQEFRNQIELECYQNNG